MTVGPFELVELSCELCSGDSLDFCLPLLLLAGWGDLGPFPAYDNLGTTEVLRRSVGRTSMTASCLEPSLLAFSLFSNPKLGSLFLQPSQHLKLGSVFRLLNIPLT